MSRLSAFLHPAVEAAEKEVFVSKRFQDENGRPVPFKIRPVTQEELDAITKQSQRVRTVKGRAQEYLDGAEMNRRIVVKGTVEPDFTDAELCQAYGVLDPMLVPGRMLLAGEFNQLRDAIEELSGFNGSAEEEAKN